MSKLASSFVIILKDVFTGWTEANGSMLAAAVAFYGAISLAPLTMILLILANTFFGSSAAVNEFINNSTNSISPQIAEAATRLLPNTYPTANRNLTTIIGVLVILYGASNLFYALKQAINILWGLAPKPDQTIWVTLRTHFFAFVMVITLGLLILLLNVASTVIIVVRRQLESILPQVMLDYSPFINWFLPVVLMIVIFALVFKILPDAKLSWRDVLIGATVTGVFFSLGGYLTGIYFSYSRLDILYGAIGSIVIILLWIYYSAIIFLLGAKFTQVYANHFGSRLRPSRKARELIRTWKDHQP